MIDRLREAVKFADAISEPMRFDQDAENTWIKIYPCIGREVSGMLGAIISRSEAQIRRIACIYTLLDLSDTVRLQHLQASLAVWEYAEQSCEYIFQDQSGDQLMDTLMQALTQTPGGMTRTQINDLFSGHSSKQAINTMLKSLQESNSIYAKKTKTGGRPVDKWFITNVEKDEKAE